MKIAIITSRYPSESNPYNHMFVHMRSLEFIKLGIQIEILVPSNVNKKYTYQGISIIQASSKEIQSDLDKYDLLYLHLLNIYPFEKSDGWPLYEHIMINKMPFAMYVHGSEVQKYGARMFEFNYKLTDFLRWFKKDVLVIPKIKKFIKITKDRENATFLFPSQWMKRDLEQNLSTHINKYHIIPNGIDCNLFEYEDLFKNRYKLITLRPLSSKKYAVDIAIDTMQYLPEQYTLDIYGKGQYKLKYQKKIELLGLSDRVKIKDEFIERQSLNHFFRQYGVFLSPTRMDAQGVTMCEAMASGLLTVSNNNTAIPEFINNFENGILENTPEEMAKTILKITNDENLFTQITISARNSMEKIDSALTVKKELDILKTVLK